MNGNIDSLMEKLSPDSDTEIPNITSNNPSNNDNGKQIRFSESNEKTSSNNTTANNNNNNNKDSFNNNKMIINNNNNNNNQMFNVHGASHYPSYLNNQKNAKTWKLISDPCLKKGAPKQYRFEGIVSSKDPIIELKDPRPFAPLRPNVVKEPMILFVPRFKIDKNYVAEPPSIEVSITNLNDNINNTFLEDLLKKFGAIEEIEIFYHPKTNKHLGLAKIIFMTPSGARACVNKLNKTSVMGNIIDVFLDPFANKINQIYDSILNPSSSTNIINENLNNFIDPNRINEFNYDIANNNNNPNLSTSSSFENSTPFNFSNINEKQYYDNSQGNSKSNLANSEGDKSPIRESLESRIQGLNLKGLVSQFLDDPSQESNFSLPNLINNNNNNINNDEYPFQRKNFQKVIDESDAILSPPPSPFLSDSEYLKWHKVTKEIDSKIGMINNKINNNDIENKRLQSDKKNYRYNENYYDSDENDSRMSVSTLSSGEKFENHALPNNNNVYGILPLIPGFANWHGNFKPINNSISQQFMYPSFLQNNAQSFGQHFSGFNSSILRSLNDSFNKLEDNNKRNQLYFKQNKESLNDLSEKILEESMKEFKTIIIKDIYKKIVENFSFKLFDQWWENSEKETNDTVPNKLDTVSDAKSSRTEVNIPFFNHPNFERSIQNIQNSLSQNFNEYGVSRGLKAAMVKMPSFKKKKPKSPVRTNDKLSDISDEENYIRRRTVHGKTKRYYDNRHNNKHHRSSISPDSYSSRNKSSSSSSSSSNYSDSESSKSQSESESDDYDEESDDDDDEDEEADDEDEEEEEEVSGSDEETIQKEKEVFSESDEEDESDAASILSSQSKSSLLSAQSSKKSFESSKSMDMEVVQDEPIPLSPSSIDIKSQSDLSDTDDFQSYSDSTDTADETLIEIRKLPAGSIELEFDLSKVEFDPDIENPPEKEAITKRCQTLKNEHNYPGLLFSLPISSASRLRLQKLADESRQINDEDLENNYLNEDLNNDSNEGLINLYPNMELMFVDWYQEMLASKHSDSESSEDSDQEFDNDLDEELNEDLNQGLDKDLNEELNEDSNQELDNDLDEELNEDSNQELDNDLEEEFDNDLDEESSKNLIEESIIYPNEEPTIDLIGEPTIYSNEEPTIDWIGESITDSDRELILQMEEKLEAVDFRENYYTIKFISDQLEQPCDGNSDEDLHEDSDKDSDENSHENSHENLDENSKKDLNKNVDENLDDVFDKSMIEFVDNYAFEDFEKDLNEDFEENFNKDVLNEDDDENPDEDLDKDLNKDLDDGLKKELNEEEEEDLFKELKEELDKKMKKYQNNELETDENLDEDSDEELNADVKEFWDKNCGNWDEELEKDLEENSEEDSDEDSYEYSNEYPNEYSAGYSGEDLDEAFDKDSDEDSYKYSDEYSDEDSEEDLENELNNKLSKESKQDFNNELNKELNKESKEDENNKLDLNLETDLNKKLETVTNNKLEADSNNQLETDTNELNENLHNKKRKTLKRKFLSDEDFLTVASEVRKAKIKNISYKEDIDDDDDLLLNNNNNKVDVPISTPTPISTKDKFKKRDSIAEKEIIYEFEKNGIDSEDISYLKRQYKQLLQEENEDLNSDLWWINDVHWVDHPATYLSPPKKKRKNDDPLALRIHKTGCARSEGYYKVDRTEKLKYLVDAPNTGNEIEDNNILAETKQTVPQQSLREARSNQRRLISMVEQHDLPIFKLNKLEFRKKKVKFAKSKIHVWGLFAMQHIPQHEFVIEYIGQQIRPMLADLREKRYGTGSSYFFKIDSDTIIDATDSGNVARFINHSCNPNCYAKVIFQEGQKRIVIYSKQAIEPGQEITYDYKFPIENDKIPCLCQSQGCRGFLN